MWTGSLWTILSSLGSSLQQPISYPKNSSRTTNLSFALQQQRNALLSLPCSEQAIHPRLQLVSCWKSLWKHSTFLRSTRKMQGLHALSPWLLRLGGVALSCVSSSFGGIHLPRLLLSTLRRCRTLQWFGQQDFQNSLGIALWFAPQQLVGQLLRHVRSRFLPPACEHTVKHQPSAMCKWFPSDSAEALEETKENHQASASVSARTSHCICD